MKVFKKIFLSIFIGIVIILISGYFWLRSTNPIYSGEINLSELDQKVEVVFDDFGVPHIYANNAHDAYMTLGYLQAQERLFQMEMIRRVTSGRLSELLGESMVETDKTMLTLSITDMAQRSADKFFENTDQPYKKETLAYLKGVNNFIDNGKLPIEFTLLDFKPEHFKPVDVYTAIGYMALSFTSALYQDPLATQILQNLGEEYLLDFNLDSISHNRHYESTDEISGLSYVNKITEVLDKLIIPVWHGSNNWVLSSSRSKSGKVLLANDTHVKYSQPAVWYEAYMEYPGFELGGYYLASVPYAAIGHNKSFAWGVTIFPFDNMDLYQEKQNPDNSNQVWVNDHWEDYVIKTKTIPVKDKPSVEFEIKKTRHGPVINGVYNNVAKNDEPPVALWWALNDMESTVMEALYLINNSKNINDFESAMKYIDLIGMNIVYGDADGNIALWSAGKIPIRPKHVNPKFILDGASGNDEILGYYPFSKNPKIINPESGFITTANDEPIRVDGVLYPGYYASGIRARRIKKLMSSKEKWSLDDLKAVQLDNTSERDTILVNLILDNANLEAVMKKGPTYQLAIDQLRSWDGASDIDNVGTTIFNNIIYFVIYNIVGDEMIEDDKYRLIESFLVRANLSSLLANDNSPWFDNIDSDKIETRSMIFTKSLEEGITSLINQFGDDLSKWKWGKVHTLTHVHAIGRSQPFDMIFNVGPFAKSGSNDVIDKEGFRYNSSGVFPIVDGPAMRLLVDLSDSVDVLSIIPTGQSGNVISQHYSDQSYMFNNGDYRVFNYSKDKINNSRVLLMHP
ncbi:MAG: hypothetical protein CMF58_06350 [Lentimicrobiaceae bacterium]|nr:hypothetical protein [Lentimicrobiaceae bacterium]